jgi:hypothetical protein
VKLSLKVLVEKMCVGFKWDSNSGSFYVTD